MKLYGHQIRIHLTDGKNHVELLGTEAEGRKVIAEQETGDDLRHAIGAFRDLAKARQAAATPAPAPAPEPTIDPLPAQPSTTEQIVALLAGTGSTTEILA